MPLFQRKGGATSPNKSGADDAPRSASKQPQVTIAIGHGTPGNNSGPGDGGIEHEPDGNTCPNCGCVFTPDGDVVEEGAPVEGGGYDEGAPEMSGGPPMDAMSAMGGGGMGGAAGGDLASAIQQKLGGGQ